MKPVHISVALCTHNRAEMLRCALDSILAQETIGAFSYDVVVVDDASTDNTAQVIAEAAERSTVLVTHVHSHGEGLPRARNVAIQNAKGEWIAFTDDDQLVCSDWLFTLLMAAVESGALCVGGARKLCSTSGAPLSNLSHISRAILGEIDNGPLMTEIITKKHYPCTGNVLVRRDVFDIVGVFSELETWGCEDNEFFTRVRMARIRVYYSPNAMVYHMIPSSRMTDEYLLWTSLRQGGSLARRDSFELGTVRAILMCFARLGQTTLIHAPLFIWAHLAHNCVEEVG